MDSNKVRLTDVFITGPLQIIISTYITTSPLLRYFMLITGISTIIYNGHNFLLFDSVLKKPLPDEICEYIFTNLSLACTDDASVVLI